MDARANKRRLSEQFPASAAESRSEKRPAKTPPIPRLGPIKAPNGYDEPVSRPILVGTGIQHSGSGKFIVKGKVTIGRAIPSDSNVIN